MAYIKSDDLFVQSIFSFRPMFAESRNTEFYNDQPYGYETTIPWSDSIETAYVAGRGTNFTTAFTGDALSISPLNIATGTLSGRVEGMFTYAGHRTAGDLVHATSVWGFDVRLSQIRTVALTTDATDDRALLGTILAGNDIISLSRFGDVVSSFGGNDIVRAGSGSDSVNGGAGADVLLGQAGIDTLKGGDGTDRIVGGRGADELYGGAGADRFIFDDGHLGLGIGARDRVYDWDPREDVLDFSLIDGNTNVDGDQQLSFNRSYADTLVAARNTVLMSVSGEDVIFRFDVTGDTVLDFDLCMVGAKRFYNYLFKYLGSADIDRLFDL